MYFICKCWQFWTLYDKINDHSRLVLEPEMERLSSAFPMLFSRHANPMEALLISAVSMAKLPQLQKPTENGIGTKKALQGPKYLIFKMLNTWTISDLTKGNSRPMETSEIDLVTTFFPSLIGHTSAPIEALSLSRINFSKLEQLTEMTESPPPPAKKPVSAAKA